MMRGRSICSRCFSSFSSFAFPSAVIGSFCIDVQASSLHLGPTCSVWVFESLPLPSQPARAAPVATAPRSAVSRGGLPPKPGVSIYVQHGGYRTGRMSVRGDKNPSATGPPSADVGFSNRPFWVKHFQAIHHWVLMSLAGSRFSSESALRPFHHGVRRRGGTIYWAACQSRQPIFGSPPQFCGLRGCRGGGG